MTIQQDGVLRIQTPMLLPSQSVRTIDAGGAVTLVQGHSIIAANSGTADDLDTINLDENGSYNPLFFILADAGDTITLRDGAGNIQCPGAVNVAITEDTPAWCLYDDSTNTVYVLPGATGGAGSDTTAIHDNEAGEIAAITEKVTPVNADLLVIEDSAAANVKKRVQIGNLPGSLPTVDTTAIVKGSADATKLLRFEVDGFTTGTTRVATPPNEDFTMVGVATAQALTNKDLTDATNTFAVTAAEIVSGTLLHERGGLEADVSAYGGVPLISGGATSQIKYNLVATAAPTVDDDSGDGYVVGSRWVDVTNDKEYVALDVTVGAAVWTETTATGSGAPTGAQYLALATDAGLSAERVFTPGSGLAGSDGGANGAYTLNVDISPLSAIGTTDPAADLLVIEDVTDGSIKKATPYNLKIVKIAILRDEKADGTAGGASSATTWNARDLNTEHYDPDGIVSISSNQFTPIAGDYLIQATAPGNGAVGVHRLRLYNVTGAASVMVGGMATSAAGVQIQAPMVGKFTANGTDAYRIDHWTNAAVATSGLGGASSDTGEVEVYLQILLVKLA